MRSIAIAAFTLIALPAFAQEQPVELKPGPGLEVVQMRCSGCHSLDYIPMNSPFLDKAGWTAEVGKMRGMFHAPMEDADVPAIIDYLVANYSPK